MEARVNRLFVAICLMVCAALVQRGLADDVRSLYRQAAEAIDSSDTRAAVESLEKLVAIPPEGPLLELAVIHLAECYLQLDRATDADTLLAKWSEVILKRSNSEKPEQAPNAEHFLRVWLHTTSQLQDHDRSIQSLKKMLEQLSTSQWATNRIDIEIELVRQYLLARQPKIAKQLVDQLLLRESNSRRAELLYLSALCCQQVGDKVAAVSAMQQVLEADENSGTQKAARLLLAEIALEDGDITQVKAILEPWNESAGAGTLLNQADDDLRVRVLLSQCYLADHQPREALKLLPQDTESIPPAQEVAIRFARANAALQLDRLEPAKADFEWLAGFADNQLELGSPVPDWAVTVELKLAECELKQKDYPALKARVGVVKQRYPKFEHLDEFDYLLARASMFQIEFEQARAILDDIINSNTADGPKLRAQWMVGESYFLERKYSSAITAYLPVAEADKQPWKSLAILQTAKCYELQGDSAAALEQYQKLANNQLGNRKLDKQLVAEAEQRIETIRAAAEKLRQLR